MTKDAFYQRWNLTYPETVQISHLFKHDYAVRWLRIHSLPDSKRYAENYDEWDILLTRQNDIITDILGSDTNVLLVTGDYYWGDENDIHITAEVEIFTSYSFTRLDDIYLHKLDAENYDETDVYRPAFAETIWKYGTHDQLLRAFAVDNARAFFVSFEKNIIIAPYDGGIDFILKDVLSKDFYKEKYSHWLSEREDGL
jgi:hypothetical protein